MPVLRPTDFMRLLFGITSRFFTEHLTLGTADTKNPLKLRGAIMNFRMADERRLAVSEGI